jgi:hypothetical protein
MRHISDSVFSRKTKREYLNPFNFMSCYIDDVLSLNNTKIGEKYFEEKSF